MQEICLAARAARLSTSRMPVWHGLRGTTPRLDRLLPLAPQPMSAALMLPAGREHISAAAGQRPRWLSVLQGPQICCAANISIVALEVLGHIIALLSFMMPGAFPGV